MVGLRGATESGTRAAACFLICIYVMVIAAPHTACAAPDDSTTVVATKLPGVDLPLRGQALFDVLRAEFPASHAAQPIPFPLSALLTRLRALVPMDKGNAPYAAALIPIGRSLQRNAAASEYFRYPRVVVAMVAESAEAAAPLLKDRLYFAYQEQAGVLEVISYNEAMGRFEFQVVKDYRAGGNPRVYYARRAICTSCHQNHAPIFARPLWGETNANPAVAARLAAQHRDFYGLPLNVSIDVPGAIDDAVQRANRFGLAQKVWREGCARAARISGCRAALLNAALQLRLSGGLGYAANDPDFKPLRSAWQQRWPQGLGVPNPDIPNREPLTEINAATAREVVVPAALDPLLPRPPLAVLHFDQATAQDELIAQLAQFFAATDIATLDRALFARGAAATRPTSRAPCGFTRNLPRFGAWRLDVRCQNTSGDPLAVEGRLYFIGRRLQRAVFDRLALSSDDIDDVSVAVAAPVVLDARGITLPLQRGGLHVRRHNGNALARIVLQWPAQTAYSPRFTGSVVVEEQADYAPLHAAVQHLAATATIDRDQPLSSATFQRARVVPALFAQLGIATPAACCGSRVLSAPQLEPVTTLDLTRPTGLVPAPPAALQRLQRYCAPCHDSAASFPPNFLSGDLATVQEKLTHCAARIDYRLRMWTLPAAQRGKTPMPPELALRADQRDPQHWPGSNEYRQLRQYINSLRTAPVATTRDYTQLDSCLP